MVMGFFSYLHLLSSFFRYTTFPLPAYPTSVSDIHRSEVADSWWAVLMGDTPLLRPSSCGASTPWNTQDSCRSPPLCWPDPWQCCLAALNAVNRSASPCHISGLCRENSGICPLVTLAHHLFCGFFPPHFVASVPLCWLFAEAAVQQWPDYFWQELWITARMLPQRCANFDPSLTEATSAAAPCS